MTTESDFVNGPVRFSDGGVDFILVEPHAAFLFGLELGVRFRPAIVGTLAVSYSIADARYIENDNLRRDVGFNTLRLQPGVMFNVFESGRVGLSVGGGLTVARIQIDGLVWSDRRIDPYAFALGLYGAGGLDVGITERIGFHAHLMLEGSRPLYGAFEADLARADGEFAAGVAHDLRAAVLVAVGVSIAL